MALDFAVARGLRAMPAGRPGEGFVPLVLDERRVARRADPAQAPAALRMRYRLRGERVWLGTNAYFFEEGAGARYQSARFGEFRVDPASGEAVLVGLRDKDLKPID